MTDDLLRNLTDLRAEPDALRAENKALRARLEEAERARAEVEAVLEGVRVAAEVAIRRLEPGYSDTTDAEAAAGLQSALDAHRSDALRALVEEVAGAVAEAVNDTVANVYLSRLSDEEIAGVVAAEVARVLGGGR